MLQAPPSMVLVVDDDADVRRILASILADGGYAVRTAAGGREALELAERERPHLVITDLIMPSLDGWEVIVELRQRGVRVPVILISGHAQPAKDPAVRFLAKPIDVDVLLATVADVLANGDRGGQSPQA